MAFCWDTRTVTVTALHSHPLVLSLQVTGTGCSALLGHLMARNWPRAARTARYTWAPSAWAWGLGGIRGISCFFRGVRPVSHCFEQDSSSPEELCVCEKHLSARQCSGIVTLGSSCC